MFQNEVKLKYIEMQIGRKICLVAVSFFMITMAQAQEIPSRVNEGVNVTTKNKNARDVYAGLDLTREQQKQLQLLKRDSRQKAKEINDDSTLSTLEKRTKLRSVRQELTTKRSSILTPEQLKKYDENVKKLKNKSGEGKTQSVTNNLSENKSKDDNGLNRNSKKMASKKKGAANWNNLNLSKEQKSQMSVWNEEYQTRLRTIRNDGSLKGDQKEDQIMQLVREQDLQLGNILSPEQKVRWDENLHQQKMLLSERELKRNPRLFYTK